MSETVDTRVVEAKFDSKQFEQGVDKTVKKLDELKQSLNLKDGEKSVAQIGSKIEETSKKASDSLENLEKRFTSFFGMLKQKLIGGIADEIVGGIFKIKHNIEGLITSLSSAQISVGMNRYTDMLTSVRTLVSAGVNQDKAYEAIERLGQYADQTSYSLDAMVSTMSKFKTAGADIDTAARMIEGLSNAAASMGVNAQQAERAYLNLQQAYSKKVMMQNDWISFESLPMVGTQFNQAIIDAAVKVGTLQEDKKKKDGTVTYKTKKQPGTKIRAASGITAENLGSNLQSRWFTDKVMEEVFGNTYYFEEIGIDEFNAIKAKEREFKEEIKKEVDAGAIDSAEADKKVDEKLQEYLDTISKEKIDAKKEDIERRKEAAKAELEAKKDDAKAYDEAKKNYDKLIKDLDKELAEFEKQNHLTTFGYQALRAGQEARSFTDVLNTLKDAISRGWSTSFEYIFGKLDEATDFFTKLTESNLANAIYRIGEFRNLVLENWRAYGGREDMLSVLQGIDDTFGSIFKKMGLIEDETKNDIFDQSYYEHLLEIDPTGYAARQYKDWAEKQDPFEYKAQELGERLSMLGRDIKDFFAKIHKWFMEADSTGTSRLQRISNILSAFGTVGSGALNTVAKGLQFIGKLYNTFKTSFDHLWQSLEKLTYHFTAIFDPQYSQDGFSIYQAIYDTFNNILTIAEKLNGPLTTVIDILTDVAGFFIDMGMSTMLMNIQFFTDGFGLLLEILGLGSAQQARGHGVLEGITNGIKDLGDTCKSVMGSVNEFFGSLFADLRKILGLNVDESNPSGEEGGLFKNIENWFNTNEFINKVRTWIDKAITDIGDFIKDLPNRIKELGIKIGDAFKSLFYTNTIDEEVVTPEGQKVKVTKQTEWIKRPLTAWLEQAIADVWSFITVDIPNFIKDLPSIVGSFIHSLLYEDRVVDDGYGTSIAGRTSHVEEVPTALKVWLDQASADVTKFITEDIPQFVLGLPSVIGSFIHSLFWNQTVVDDGYGTSIAGRTSHVEEVPSALKQWLDTAVADVWNFITVEIPKFVMNIPSIVSEFFNGIFYEKKQLKPDAKGRYSYQDTRTPLKIWLDGAIDNVKKFIKELPAKIKKLPSVIGEFFKKLFYQPVTVSGVGTTWVKKPFTQWIDENVIKPVSEFIKNLPTYIGQGIGTVVNFIGTIVGAIFGKSEGEEMTSSDVEAEIEKPFLGIDLGNILTTLKDIGRKLINGVISIFSGKDEWADNKNWLSEKFREFINNIQTSINEFWPKVDTFFRDLPGNVKTWFDDAAKQAEGDGSPIGSAVAKFVGSIATFISGIPLALLNAWDAAKVGLGSIWEKIVTWVTGDGKSELNEYNQGLFNIKYQEWLAMPEGDAKDKFEEDLEKWKKSLLDEQWRNDNPALANISDFFTEISSRLSDFPTLVEDGWNAICNWITVDLPNAISGWFNDDAKVVENEDSPIVTNLKKFIDNLGVFISHIPNDLLRWWRTAENVGTTLYSKVWEWVTGDKQLGGQLELNEYNQGLFNLKYQEWLAMPEGDEKDKIEEDLEKWKESLLDTQWREDNPVAANIRDFFEHLGEYLIEKVKNLPTDIANGLNASASLIQTVLEKATGWFNADNAKKESEELAKSAVPEFDQKTYDELYKKNKQEAEDYKKRIAAEKAEYFKNQGPKDAESDEATGGFLEAISSFGGTIAALITETIPGFIGAGFTWVKNNVSGWITAIKDFFSGGTSAMDEETDKFGQHTETSLGNKIQAAIRKVFKKDTFKQEHYDELLKSHSPDEAEHYKARSSNPIIQFFRDIISGVGDIFNTLGPTVLDGITKAVDWVGAKLGDISTWLTEQTTNDKGEKLSFIEILDKQFTDKETGKENPIWTKVKELGQSLKTIIIEVIPGFLESAFNYIAKELPNIISRVFSGEGLLGSFFGGGDKKKDAKKQLKTDDTKTWDAYGKWYTKQHDQRQSAIKELADEEKEIEHLLEIDPGGFGARKYQEWLENQAKSSKQESKVSKEITKNTDATAKNTEEAAQNVAGSLGQLEYLLGDAGGSDTANTIAQLTGGGIGGFNLFSLFGSFAGAEESGNGSSNSSGDGNNDPKKQKSFFENLKEGLGTIFGFFTDIADKIKNNSILKVILVVAGFFLILRELRIMVDNMAFLDDIGWTAKWIGLGVLITVLSTVLGYITILAAQADDQTVEGKKAAKKLERVKQVFTDLKKMLLDLMTPLLWIFGFLTVKSIFDYLKEAKKSSDGGTTIRNSRAGGVSTTVTTLLGNLEQSILEPFTEFLKVGAKVSAVSVSADAIGSAAENISGNIMDVLGNLGTGVETFTDYLPEITKNLKDIKDDAEEAILVIPVVKELFGKIIELLNIETIDSNSYKHLYKFKKTDNKDILEVLDERTGEWSTISASAVELLDKNFDENGEAYGFELTKVKHDILGRLNDMTYVFNSFSGSLALFKNAITGSGDDSVKVADALTKITGSWKSMQKFVEFVESNEGKSWEKFKGAMMSLGAIFRLYQDSIGKEFGEKPKEENIENLVDLLDQLFGNEKFKNSIEKFAAKEFPELDTKVLDNAEKIIIFAASISSIAKACSELSDDGSEATNINKLLGLIKDIDFQDSGDGKNIDKIVNNLGALGNALGSFAANTASMTQGNLGLVEQALNSLVSTAISLNRIPDDSFFSNLIFGKKTLGSFGVKIKQLGDNMKHFFDSISNVDSNGMSHNYNKHNLQAVLYAVDILSKVAARFVDMPSLSGFEEFSKSSFSTLGENITSFITMLLGKDPNKEIATYTSDDFEYLEEVMTQIGYIANILARFDKLELTNLQDPEKSGTSKLYGYLDDIFYGMSHFYSKIDAYSGVIREIYANRTYLNGYLDLVLDIVNIVNNLTRIANSGMTDLHGLNANKITEIFTAIQESFFGKTEIDILGKAAKDFRNTEDYVAQHTTTVPGLFDRMIDYFTNLGDLEEKLKGMPNSVAFFDGISKIFISFAEALGHMADAAPLESMFSGYALSEHGLDYSSYVTKLCGVLDTIIQNQQTFTDFFNYGSQFEYGDLNNTLLLLTSLNEVAQLIAAFDTQVDFNELFKKVESFEWSRIFGVIQDRIVFDNQDFFSPTIRPVLEITDDFKSQAAELKKELGFILDQDGNWIGPQMTIALNGTEFNLPALDGINTKLEEMAKTITSIESIASNFNAALASSKFTLDIDGQHFAEVVGPKIDQYLGSEATRTSRGDINNGGSSSSQGSR